jgi:nitrate/nitrite-specific signal transduction histidine kinase
MYLVSRHICFMSSELCEIYQVLQDQLNTVEIHTENNTLDLTLSESIFYHVFHHSSSMIQAFLKMLAKLNIAVTDYGFLGMKTWKGRRACIAEHKTS